MKSEEKIEQAEAMICRAGCAACCVAPSISSAIPGMPRGKLAGERCVQLSKNYRCLLFGDARRPEVCVNLQASKEMCGDTARAAFKKLFQLERITQPAPVRSIKTG